MTQRSSQPVFGFNPATLLRNEHPPRRDQRAHLARWLSIIVRTSAASACVTGL